jgi:iron complex outermembrane recepter protein
MKQSIFSLFLVCTTTLAVGQTSDSITTKALTPLSISATRASSNAPFTNTELNKSGIAKLNNGSDLPIMLNGITNLVSNSDAGAGVGYTALRLRGNDITRINITINGVPVNDAEGQGVFFVNFGDIASSAQSIQVQRGVGSSTNGPGAFAGSISLNTLDLSKKPGATIMLDESSFNTLRRTYKFYSGETKSGLNFSARFSRVSSDGYIDRASSRLLSGQFTAQYTINRKTNATFNYMRGRERTYQSWNGISAALIDSVRTFNTLGQKSDGTFYNNQTDNYGQDYFQLFLNRTLSKSTTLAITPYLTLGKGYYEEWRNSDNLQRYGIAPIIVGTDTFTERDLVRQLWLNNVLIGVNANLAITKQQYELIAGINASSYNGKHFGEILQVDGKAFNQRWYDLKALKNEASAFTKMQYKLKQVNLFAELQGRLVQYNIDGFRNNPNIILRQQWAFFNPKLGANFAYGQRKLRGTAYASFAIANKEPNRDDLEASPTAAPMPERLYNIEIGNKLYYKKLAAQVNVYYMAYENQLILTGKINDVGAYTRINTPNSYRAGIEADLSAKPSKWFTVGGNIAYSANKIARYTEYVDDYDNGIQIQQVYTNTDIAFSPNIVAALNATAVPIQRLPNLNINATWKYVGEQYLDNTQNKARSLDAWQHTDLRCSYTHQFEQMRSIQFNASVFNLTNTLFNANGYTFSYKYGGIVTTENYLFPQAGRRFGLGCVVQL